MTRFSNIRLPDVLSPLSIWRAGLEGKLKASRDIRALNTSRASLQFQQVCMGVISHTTSRRISKSKQWVTSNSDRILFQE